jgi:hypothetical protein
MVLPRTPQELAFHTDRHGVLVVPAVFWLSLVVLARYWVMFLLVGVSARRDGGQSAAALAGVPVSWLALAGQALVLLVALAAMRRGPNAGGAVRMVWRFAPWLLLITAVCNAAILVPLIGRPQAWSPWPDLFLASCSLLDAAVVLAVFRAPYYRQLFQEFPAPAGRAA